MRKEEKKEEYRDEGKTQGVVLLLGSTADYVVEVVGGKKRTGEDAREEGLSIFWGYEASDAELEGGLE